MSIDATCATWKLQNISAIQKLILLSLADRADELGCCWPSVKRIEADTCLNRKTIIENRQILIDKNLISYTGELKGRQKQIPVMKLNYVSHREGMSDIDLDEFLTDTENGTGKKFTSTENGTRTSTENGTLNLSIESIEKKKEKAQLSTGSQESFECFFSIYPIKKAKNRALAAWLSQNCHSIAEEIILKLQEQIEKDSQFLEGYAPNPDKYILEERWKDEIYIRPKNNKSSKNKKATYDDTSTEWKRLRNEDIFI